MRGWFSGPGIGVLDTRYLRLDASNDPVTAGLEVNAATTGEPVLILQTTDDNATNPILEIQASGGGMLAEIEKDGNLNFATATAANPGMIEINDVRLLHTYGDRNLFVGLAAGNFTLTGQRNVGIGASLPALTTGNYNVAMGHGALDACTTGLQNAAIGLNALRDLVDGSYNMAIGPSALRGNISGGSNVAVGQGALIVCTASDNVAIGSGALVENIGGENNVALGKSALLFNIGGSRNVGIGTQSGDRNENGDDNVFIGHHSGFGANLHDKERNVMIGYRAGFATLAADNNILIGYQAGDVITTGDANIIIGYDIDPSAAGASNEINIGGVYKGNVSTPVFTLPVAGTIGDGGITNYTEFATDGDLTFVGTAGLTFGSCWGMEIGWSQANAVQNTWYDISDANMNDGKFNNVTHDGNGQLTVLKDGMYAADWAGSFEASAANVHVLITFSVNGIEVNDGMNHFETVAVSREAACSGNAILDLTANDTVNVSISTTDAGTPDLSVDHLMLRLVQVGGT